MAVIETFAWCVRLDSTGQVDTRALVAQFGDGYEQVADEGINRDRTEWQISVRGRDVAPLAYEFLIRHGMTRAFVWAPPLGEAGLYRRSGPLRIGGQGGGIFTVSTTFKQFTLP